MSFPEPRPERLSMVVTGVKCRNCRKDAEHHEFRGGREYHYCSEHAELYLWWYIDDPARVAAGLPPLTDQSEGREQQLFTIPIETARQQMDSEAEAASRG